MQIDKVNNLLELFYKQYLKQDKDAIFLQSLKEPTPGSTTESALRIKSGS